MPNKIKNISLNRGIVRTPGYSQSEGELSECINLIPRGGELVNILPPYPTGVTPIAGTEVFLAVHRVSPENIDHFIVFFSGALHWRTDTSRRTYLLSTTQADIKSIQPIGNILCITTTSGIHYFLWKDGAYVDLEDADFNLDIQFGIKSSLKQDQTTIDDARLEQISDSSGNYYHWQKRTELNPNATTASITTAQDSGLSPAAGRHTYMVKLEVPDGMKGYVVGVWVYYPGSNDIAEEYYGKSGESTLVFTTGLKEVDGQQVPPRGITIFVQRDNYRAQYRVMSKVALYLADTSASTSAPDEFILTGAEEGIMALANGMVAREAEDNRFVMPFFARYGVKLTTGQIINLSAPCYLVPNALYAPTISFHTANVNNVLVEGYFRGTLYSAELYYVIDDNGMLDKLRELEDIVESVVVMITPPVYLYDQALKPGGLSEAKVRRTNTFRNYIPASGSDAAVWTGAKSWGVNYNSSYTLDDGIKFDTPTDAYMLLLPTGGEARVRSANYGGSINTSTNQYDTAIEQRRFDALSTWYIVAEIPLKALNDDAEWKKVALEKGALAALYAQQSTDGYTQFTDTATSNTRLVGTNGVFSYNNRLFYLGGTERKRYDWNPVRMNGFVPDGSDTGAWRPYSSKTSSDEPLNVYMYFSESSYYLYSIPFRNGSLWHKANFIAFPDPSIIMTSTFKVDNDFVMRSHNIANMAVGFFDEAADSIPRSGAERTYPDTTYPNKLYMSYANQPLALDRNAALTFSGEIRAMSVVTKALTQGQFGKFPLYVFTSDGIWMLEINDEGAIRFSNPVSRDVITAGTQPLQTDDAIFFITEQGLKRVVGQEVTLVSEPVHGFNPRGSKLHINQEYSIFKWHAELLAQDDTVDFVKALQSARLLYDYTQQLIHVYIGTSTHYVYSKSDNAWAQQILISGGTDYEPEVMANPTGIIPAYPLSYVQYQNSRLSALCQYSAQTKNVNDLDTAPQRGLFFAGRIALALTRPITLEDPTTMAALMDFRLIKQDTGRHYSMMRPWATAIFGSRDGAYWHHITSLKRGSYKYFRFLILTNMTDNESVQGLTIAYQPRRTNRLR